MSDLYVSATTCFFWDLEDFPVPPGRCVESFPRNIEAALEIEGYRGEVFIFVYDAGKISYELMCHFRKVGILFVAKEENKCTRLNKMLTDMVYWACFNPPILLTEEVNLMVIAKDIPEGDTEFFNVLDALSGRNFNVFLVVPDDCPPEELPLTPTASLVWRWTNLFDGRIPIESDSDSDEDKVLSSSCPCHKRITLVCSRCNQVKAAHLTEQCECAGYFSCKQSASELPLEDRDFRGYRAKCSKFKTIRRIHLPFSCWQNNPRTHHLPKFLFLLMERFGITSI